MAGVKPTQWYKWLPLTEWWYNTAYHSIIGMTPNKALYGKEAPNVNFHQVQKSNVATVEEFVRKRAELQGILKENLQKSTREDEI